MLTLFRAQPRAFQMIFLLEIWERFGYYTVQGILTVFFIRQLGFSESDAYLTFGAFFALVFGMISFGGYLGDKVLGTKRTIVLGLMVLALGYLSLALASKAQVFWALGLVCVGNGLFKANPSSLLAKCYPQDDPRLHGAFTLYYMAINLGSTFALVIGPSVAARFGYSYAYFISFIGLILGLCNYWFQRRLVADINNGADAEKVPVWRWLMVLLAVVLLTCVSAYLLQHVLLARNIVRVISVVVLGFYLLYMRKEETIQRRRMVVALILMVQAIVFFTLYQQMPTSLNLFAVNNVNPTLLGLTINPQSLQALNPVWIILLSPVLAAVYNKAAVPITYKFAAGMLSCGVSFSLLFFARFAHDGHGMVSAWWLVASYFFQSSGELLVSALGVAMVAQLVPRAITGFVMGMWFLTSSIAGFIGAYVASFTALPRHIAPGVESLFQYTQVFAFIGMVTLTIGMVMWLFSARINRYIGLNQPSKDPVRPSQRAG
ncbi:MAG: oligopeptide:H+ symporter [Tatlockia sp.]|jgi:POT family proton-dependent oligopeptide transporter